MRPRPSWLSLKDGPILEFLDEHDLALPPKALYLNLNRHGHEIGYSTVRERVRVLSDNGMLAEVEDGGYYAVTDLGRRWLADDVSADELSDGDGGPQ